MNIKYITNIFYTFRKISSRSNIIHLICIQKPKFRINGINSGHLINYLFQISFGAEHANPSYKTLAPNTLKYYTAPKLEMKQ